MALLSLGPLPVEAPEASPLLMLEFEFELALPLVSLLLFVLVFALLLPPLYVLLSLVTPFAGATDWSDAPFVAPAGATGMLLLSFIGVTVDSEGVGEAGCASLDRFDRSAEEFIGAVGFAFCSMLPRCMADESLGWIRILPAFGPVGAVAVSDVWA